MSEVAIGLFSALGETTSQRVARIAAIGVHRPERLSLEDIKTVCGSALTQVPNQGPFARVNEVLKRSSGEE